MVKRTQDETFEANTNEKKQKTTTVVSLTNLPTQVFKKAFSHMIGEDLMTDGFALHTWQEQLKEAFESWFQHEDIETEHLEQFVNLAMDQLERRLSAESSRDILKPFVFDRLIPDLMEVIREHKNDLLIPKSVTQLSVDEGLTMRLRDLYVHENGLLCYASRLYKDQALVPYFYQVHALDETSTAIDIDNLTIKHNSISDEVFNDLSEGSCVTLLNDNELLMLYNGTLFKYNRLEQEITKLEVDETKDRPKFRTSDIIMRDDQNFVVLVATSESDDPNNPSQLWNFNIPTLTWSVLDPEVRLPVADALTLHKSELYACVPSKDENKAAIFRKYNFERQEWSDVSVNGFFPLLDRMRIASIGDNIAGLGDAEGQALLFIFDTSSNEWKSIDLDPVKPDDEQMELFDTLIAKNSTPNKLILYYEYYSDQSADATNKCYLQQVDINYP